MARNLNSPATSPGHTCPHQTETQPPEGSASKPIAAPPISLSSARNSHWARPASKTPGSFTNTNTSWRNPELENEIQRMRQKNQEDGQKLLRMQNERLSVERHRKDARLRAETIAAKSKDGGAIEQSEEG